MELGTFLFETCFLLRIARKPKSATGNSYSEMEEIKYHVAPQKTRRIVSLALPSPVGKGKERSGEAAG